MVGNVPLGPVAPGTFGENLTTAGIDLTTSLLGDRWHVGSAVLEVSQPRQPCFKLGMRMGDPAFVVRFLDAGRPGAYLRIIESGKIAAGDVIRVEPATQPATSIADLASGRPTDAVLERLLADLAWRQAGVGRPNGGCSAKVRTHASRCHPSRSPGFRPMSKPGTPDPEPRPSDARVGPSAEDIAHSQLQTEPLAGGGGIGSAAASALGSAMLGLDQALRREPPAQVVAAEHQPQRSLPGDDDLIIEIPRLAPEHPSATASRTTIDGDASRPACVVGPIWLTRRCPTARTTSGQGSIGCIDPRPLPRDAAIARFLGQLRRASATQRQAATASLGYTDAYQLLTFARRASVLAMRQHDPHAVATGLTACSVLGTGSMDGRDILVAFAMLHHAAQRVGADAGELLGAAAGDADPDIAVLVEAFLRRPPAERDLRDGWGLVEVEAPGGPGLLGWGYRPWLPTLDLAGAGLRIAAIVDRAGYLADDPTLAVEMPEIWLSEARDTSLGSILGSSRGSVLLHGYLRPTQSPDHASQQLSIWVVETSDANAAASLRAMAHQGRRGAALLGLADASLFALVVARSFAPDVGPFETRASLERFARPIKEALAECAR